MKRSLICNALLFFFWWEIIRWVINSRTFFRVRNKKWKDKKLPFSIAKNLMFIKLAFFKTAVMQLLVHLFFKMTTKIPFQNLIVWKYLFDGNKREVLTARPGYNATIKAVRTCRTVTQQPERLCEVTGYCGVWMAALRKIQQQQHRFRFQYQWLVIPNRYHCIFSSTSTPVCRIRVD